MTSTAEHHSTPTHAPTPPSIYGPSPAPGPVDRPGEGSTARRLTFAVTALFVAYLPFAQTNAMLGVLARATGTTVERAGWFSTTYALALAVTVLPAAVIVTRIGARRTTVAGLGLTAVSAAVSASWLLAPAAGATLVLVALGTGGLGGGLVLSGSLAVATETHGPGQARAVGVWSAALVTSLGAGPFVASALLALAPAALMTVPAGLAALLVAAVGLGVRDPAPGRRTAPAPAAERPGDRLRIRLDVLRLRSVQGAAVAATVGLFAVVGSVALVGASLAGSSPLRVAGMLALLFGANALASLVATRVADRYGRRASVVTGLVAAAVGAALRGPFLPAGLLLLGAGAGVVLALAAAVAIGDLDPARAGSAAALTNTARQLGAAAAPASVTALLAVAPLLPVLVVAALLVAAAVTVSVLLKK